MLRGEAAEHHAVVRRVRHREVHVGDAHGVEAGAAAPAPGLVQRRPQHPEPLGGDLVEQRLLVGEVPVERRPRHAQPIADPAQRERRRPLGVDGAAPPRGAARGAGRRGGSDPAAAGRDARDGAGARAASLASYRQVLTSSTFAGRVMLTLATSLRAPASKEGFHVDLHPPLAHRSRCSSAPASSWPR